MYQVQGDPTFDSSTLRCPLSLGDSFKNGNNTKDNGGNYDDSEVRGTGEVGASLPTAYLFN